MNVNYRESILDRAYRLELIKDEYVKHQEKLSLLNENCLTGNQLNLMQKKKRFGKNFAKVIL